MDQFAELLRQRIATRLAALNLTPITAAKNAGLPRDTIRNLFRQESSLPRVDTLKSIASALSTSIAYLTGETAYPLVDGNDPDSERFARQAVMTAKPIPVFTYAQWGDYIPPPAAPEDYLDLIFMNVPGFEEVTLIALEIADDHADLFYDEGRYVVWAPRDVAGLRNGDHVVVLRQSPDGQEYTIRQLVTQRRKGRGKRPSISGGLASLSTNEDYADYVFGGDDEGNMAVIGVVVADVNFAMRPAEPGLFGGIAPGTVSLNESLNRLKRQTGGGS